MSSGIRVRLRRASATEFFVRTDSFEIVRVLDGPPMKILLRRVDQDLNERQGISHRREIEPGEVGNDSSDDEMFGISEDRLTSRQRSMRDAQEIDVVDPDEEVDEIEDQPALDEEAILRKSELQRRRKLALDRIEEEAKQETIERLLKKTSVKKSRSDKLKRIRGGQHRISAPERRQAEMKLPHHDVIRLRSFTVRDDQIASILTFPEGSDFAASLPMQPVVARPQCSAPLCTRPKIYSCSKTRKPLCSLQCYRLIQTQTQS